MAGNWIERCDANIDRMAKMQDRVGVDQGSELDVIGSIERAHAIRRCAFCTMGRECDDWLQSGRTDAPEFCPNAGYFSSAGRFERLAA